MTIPISQSEVVELSAFDAAPYNPRRISDASLARLGASLKRFGLVEDVVVNRRSVDNGWPKKSRPTTVGGHQRVRAMMAAGETRASVKWVDLSENEEKALNIALNNPHLTGEWTDDIDALLKEIKSNMAPADFDPLGLDALLADVQKSLTPGAIHNPDDVGAAGITFEKTVECPHCGGEFKL